MISKSHQVYSQLIQWLDTSPEHTIALNGRGFSNQEIKANGYRSLPIRRQEMAERLARQFDNDLSGVAGFWRNETGRWDLSGKSGILIPVRQDGKMVALKCRVDKPSSPSQKYLLLSSSPKPDGRSGDVKYPHGTAAIAAMHWPLGRPEHIDTLRITEGELKADLATAITAHYTISVPGVAMWRLAVDAVKQAKPLRVLLAFDSDKDKLADNIAGSGSSAYSGKLAAKESDWSTNQSAEDYVVGRSLAALYLSLKQAGVDVAIEEWDAKCGKGIDDVLVAGYEDEIRVLSQEQCDAFASEMLTADLPDYWIYIGGTKRFVHSQHLLELDKEQFRDKFCHEVKGDPALRALSNPAFPKCDLPIYLPGKPMSIKQDGLSYFNFWRPNTKLKPMIGDPQVFIDHCNYMVPNIDECNIMLDWLAYNLQYPGQKVHWALLLQGRQGTGKSFIGELMRRLLGEHNVSTPTNEAVHEIYTAWQKSAQLIIIEELMARGRMELMNKLKPMITDSKTSVREMHKPVYEQPNVFNILMFTNHEDAIIIDETDRRYCVIFSPARPRPVEYYEHLWQWTEANAGVVWQHLLERDLSKFKARGHAPSTSAKRQLIEESLPPLHAWAKDCIESEAWPFAGDLVGASHLMDVLPHYLRGGATLQRVSKALLAVGCQPCIQRVRMTSGAQVRVMSVRRHEVWASTTSDVLCQEYEKWLAGSQPGGYVDGNPLKAGAPL